MVDTDHGRHFSTCFHSALGPILIRADDNAVTSVQFLDNQTELPSEDPSGITDKCRMELKKYFAGELTEFSLPLNPAGTEFQKKIWNLLLAIPYGQTISYSELAIRAGNVKTIRAAGRANGANPIGILIPCHRVVGSNGTLTGYAGGLDKKRWLLLHEAGNSRQPINLFSGM